MQARTRVKVCGITSVQDADAAVRFGADALGFIFVPESPRFVGERDDLQAMLQSVPPFVTRVGVCRTVDQIPPGVIPFLDAIQCYSPVPAYLGRVIRAFPIRNAGSLEDIACRIETERPDAILLDTFSADRLGGTGVPFDWSVAGTARARFSIPIVLAGGLNGDNVRTAIETVRPFAVDVSSGVEASPGVKDHGRLEAFFRAVHSGERQGAPTL